MGDLVLSDVRARVAPNLGDFGRIARARPTSGGFGCFERVGPNFDAQTCSDALDVSAATGTPRRAPPHGELELETGQIAAKGQMICLGVAFDELGRSHATQSDRPKRPRSCGADGDRHCRAPACRLESECAGCTTRSCHHSAGGPNFGAPREGLLTRRRQRRSVGSAA